MPADTEARKKAIVDGAAKAGALYAKAGTEFGAAGSSLSWGDKTVAGIAPPSNKAVEAVWKQEVQHCRLERRIKAILAAAGKKTNDAIATGGTKNTTVNISIGKLVEKMLFEGSGKESMANMRDRIVDEITRAVAMGASLGGAS